MALSSMTDMEQRQRADEARRLMREPALLAAFEEIERVAIEELLAVRGTWPWTDRRRRILADKVNAIRDLRQQIEITIAIGDQTAKRNARAA